MTFKCLNLIKGYCTKCTKTEFMLQACYKAKIQPKFVCS